MSCCGRERAPLPEQERPSRICGKTSPLSFYWSLKWSSHIVAQLGGDSSEARVPATALGGVFSSASALTSGHGDFWGSKLCPSVFSDISSSLNSLLESGGVGQQYFSHFQTEMQWEGALALFSTSQCRRCRTRWDPEGPCPSAGLGLLPAQHESFRKPHWKGQRQRVKSAPR